LLIVALPVADASLRAMLHFAFSVSHLQSILLPADFDGQQPPPDAPQCVREMAQGCLV